MHDWPAGVDKRVLDSVDSTMAEAARTASELTTPMWILALEQTAGRGRLGRVWSDPKGNFAATLVMRPTGSAAQVALYSFVASLALREALVSLSGREADFTLKWPNDVLLRGGKLAGILLESTGQGGSVTHLSIGFGVNLQAVPENADQGDFTPVCLRAELGLSVTPEAFLDALAPAFARFEAQFSTMGFAPIRTAWLAHATRLGQVINARTTQGDMTGTFQTVDEQGALVLKDAKGSHRIAAADIYFS